MKIEDIEVYGFRKAVQGLRKPQDSQEKSDSLFAGAGAVWPDITALENPKLGPKDIDLFCQLIKKGGDERKAIRLIVIWLDITIPRYIWQELDTYKVGTVRMCSSTMNKLWNRDLTSNDFEGGEVLPAALAHINKLARSYRAQIPRNPELLTTIKRHLPESFLQSATYKMNYETAIRMYHARKNHRLPEWSGPGGICETIKKLPYMDIFLEMKP